MQLRKKSIDETTAKSQLDDDKTRKILNEQKSIEEKIQSIREFLEQQVNQTMNSLLFYISQG